MQMQHQQPQLYPTPGKMMTAAGGGGRGPAPAMMMPPPQQSLDPVNDVSMWSEHEADGRKYWYNRGTNESTAKKPLCLKTPEERAIPDCPWSEFVSPDGKKYYSCEGKTSMYVCPSLIDALSLCHFVSYIQPHLISYFYKIFLNLKKGGRCLKNIVCGRSR